MKDSLFHMEFFETYYFANILSNVIKDPIPWLRNLEDIFGDARTRIFFRPFPKFSAVHDFIESVLWSLIEEGVNNDLDAMAENKAPKSWVNRALEAHGIPHQSLADWMAQFEMSSEDLTDGDLLGYHRELYDEGPLEKLIDQLVDEVFYLMFSNREFLRQFNVMVASYIADCGTDTFDEEDGKYFRKDGVLKRVAIPMWVRRAVFYRDRGACGSCNKDISGLVSLRSQKHFDHIVPLAKGGMNDVTNIQLLCDVCNLEKSHGEPSTSTFYERWY